MKYNENVKAILVGVAEYSAYSEETPDLEWSLRDVDLMGKALVQGLRINPFHIWISTDKRGCVTRSSFLDGIRLFLQDMRPDDVMIFYFSGHGSIQKDRHFLLFSDGPLETQSVIDLFSQMHADKRILFLDCCMSGHYLLESPRKLVNSRQTEGNNISISADSSPSFWIEELLCGGTAVFASSKSQERSGYSDQLQASLFTAFLWNAMTNRHYLHHGTLSLDTIRILVCQEAAAWNEMHPGRQQHPVFRSSMGGTVSFRICEYQPYPQQKLSFDHGNSSYMVADISPLHSQIAKRYAVKVILKHAMTTEELVLINREIVGAVRHLDLFKSTREEQRWKGLPANLVFIYYGYSPEDAAQGTYAFITTWADETQNKGHWYRTNRHSKVAGDILIDTNPSYSLLHKMSQENSADSKTLLAETKKVLRQLIDEGEALIRTWQEYWNGEMSAEELRQDLEGRCRTIDRLYLETSDLPVPPLELTKWSLLASGVAGDVVDFSCVLSVTSMLTVSVKKEEGQVFTEHIAGKMPMMNVLMDRFHRDLEILREEERESRSV